MDDIKFENIRSYAGDQRKGFEELVCQIARRENPKLRRVEGAGGDGGIEAYWLLPNRKKVGFQAKYHTRTGDIDWREVDNSVRQAIDTHPDLVRYMVAFACDLTERSGKKKKGLTGWEHWDNHTAKWHKWASEKGLSIRFEVWTKSDIVDRLILPESRGLIEYWFNTPLFDISWFEKHFEAVKADLDERYHPEDHVEVEASYLCQGLTRSEAFQRNLIRLFGDIPSTLELHRHVSKLKVQPDSQVLKNLYKGLIDIQKINNEIFAAPYLPLPFDLFERRLVVGISNAESLENWLWAEDRNKENPREHGQTNYNLYKARQIVSGLSSSLENIQSRLKKVDIQADRYRAGLAVGHAGTGKSHMFADAVSQALAEDRPAILFLGQYFRSEDLWKTILGKLDLSAYSVERFLGAFEAAAEAARTRCLILVDGLNEAKDLKNLRDNIGSFSTNILQYKHLALGLSCRSEYEHLLLPDSLKAKLARVECYGFVTSEEQEKAARQYLEKRGIVRPTTPWLSPEFVNPLFLRTCCEALQKAGRREFPRGLRGAKQILRFYIDSLQSRLEQQYPAIHFPLDCVAKGLLALAKWMAQKRADCASRRDVARLLSEAFWSPGPLEGQSWLDVLVREGALRLDHEFTAGDDDPLASSKEAIRFTYQRFSDHLIVSALLSEVSDPAQAFEAKGPLNFLITNKGINLNWQNLLPALAIQVPEQFQGRELLDLLPGDLDEWWRHYFIRDIFPESILWRSATAFSDRTLDLFNELANYYDSRLALLLQLSVLKDHPWNGDFIDNVLRERKMPERDASWSVELANITDDDEYPLHRLIDWAFRADKTLAEDETLRLTALILTWCLATSSRLIRDRATKALTAVFIERPHLFPNLLHHFGDIDDFYILERLCAAGFGAVCHGVEDEAFSAIAGAVFEEIFKEGTPPPHLLMRDYARGIIELANMRGCLPAFVHIQLCRPPYKSPWPLEDVTETEIDEIRETAGDDKIYYSAMKFGDFERYTIKSHISDFTSVSLTEPCPLSDEQKLEKFQQEVKGWSDEKQVAFAQLEEAIEHLRESFATHFDSESYTVTIKGNKGTEEYAEGVEHRFVELLSPSERKLYQELVVPSFFMDRVPYKDRGIPNFDFQLAKRWITKRAYDFGWTKELFPIEPSEGIGRQRRVVERIGKKYQWLALSELMARLADNVWLIRRWPDQAIVYDQACQTSFIRDVEPTILQQPEDLDRSDQWWFPRQIVYQSEPDDKVAQWPFEARDLINGRDVIDVDDSKGRSWLVLYSFYSADERFLEDDVLLPFRRSAFVRVSSIIVKAEEAHRIKNNLVNKRLTDPTDWEPYDVTDGPFYLEYLWRNTWTGICDDWMQGDFGTLRGFKYLRPVLRHIWEHHLDATLPKGSHECIPSIWLSKQLNLQPRPFCVGQFEDESGRLVFIDPSVGTEFSSTGLIDRNVFLEFLESNSLECLWIVAGEKTATPSGSRDAWGLRWHSAVYRWSQGKWIGRPWYEDESRGLKKYLLKHST